MGYQEAVFTIDQLSKPLIAPASVKNLNISFDFTNEIAILSGKIVDATVDGNINVKTTAIEVWRQKTTPITEYGQGTKLATVTRNSNNFRYEDDYSSIDRDDYYYYAIYSIGDNGLINKSGPATYSFNSEHPSISVWGFIQDFNIGDPEPTILNPRITYLQNIEDPDNPGIYYDLLNYGFEPMHMINKTSMEPGDYENFLKNVLKNKPYMVSSYNKQADYELSSVDYTKKSDGITDSDFSNHSYSGGPFAWIQLPLVKEWYINEGTYGKRIVLWSFNKSDWDILRLYGFEDILTDNGTVVKGVWIPMGFSNNEGKIFANCTSDNAKTVDSAYNIIKNFRSDAKFFGGPILNFLRDVEYMLFKTTDIRKASGTGRTDVSTYPRLNPIISGTGYSENNTTTYDIYGTGFQGYSNRTTTRNVKGKLFHSSVLGDYKILMMDPYTLHVNGKIKVSKKYNYDLTGNTYLDSGITMTSASGPVYPAKLIKTPAGSILDGSNTSIRVGSETTYECCGCCPSNSGTKIIVRFGVGGYTGTYGPSAFNANYSSSDTSNTQAIGYSIMLLPDPNYEPTMEN